MSEISVDEVDSPPDICMIEVGGTVGDIESGVFLEALRQLQLKVGPENFCLVLERFIIYRLTFYLVLFKLCSSAWSSWRTKK